MRWCDWSFATLPQPPPKFRLTFPCLGIRHGFPRVNTYALTQTTRQITVDRRCMCACVCVCVWKNAENPEERPEKSTPRYHRLPTRCWLQAYQPNRLRPRWPGRNGRHVGQIWRRSVIYHEFSRTQLKMEVLWCAVMCCCGVLLLWCVLLYCGYCVLSVIALCCIRDKNKMGKNG